jgi:hypothetical protein
MRSYSLLSVLTLAAAVFILGCAEDPPAANSPGPAGPAAHDGAAHAHPSSGPHGGSLIELGQEQYHGELVHDEASGTVTIYLLDGTASTAVPIAAQEIVINASHDGQGEQFKLAAQPQAGEDEGMSSRFVSADSELGEHLHEHHADARLVVKIDGQSFNGAINHDHDHDHPH